MTLRILPGADRDLEDHITYFGQFDSRLGERFLSAVEQAFVQLDQRGAYFARLRDGLFGGQLDGRSLTHELTSHKRCTEPRRDTRRGLSAQIQAAPGLQDAARRSPFFAASKEPPP